MITPTKPPAIGSKVTLVSYALGFLSTALAVAQMVSFEDFVLAIQSYGVTAGGGSIALAIGLIVLEIASVPFLFRLTISPLMRLVSALAVVFLPCAWVVLTGMGLLTGVESENAGYFGHFLTVEVSSVGFTLLVVWLTIVGWAFGPLRGHEALRLGRS